MILKETNDFYKIVVENIPLIDVRAELEFKKGAFLNSVNLPLMNNEERHLVGTCYKKLGNEKAVALGNKLVCGEVKEERVQAWIKFIEKNPEAKIYCFRGGLRSRISQTWIEEASGKSIDRLEGGYKAFRNYLLDELQADDHKSIPIILGGYTGTGKTILLKKLENSIDLEGLANHRGSAFGNFATSQTTQINFDNNLAFEIIKHRDRAYKHMIVEDEGRNIGKCFINKKLVDHFKKGDLVILDESLEKRVQIIFEEYIINSQKDYQEIYKENGIIEWKKYIEASFYKNRKRLGGESYKKMLNMFGSAFKMQEENGAFEDHKKWIELLLRDYYDPMYKYQISKGARKILFKGNSDEVLEYIKSLG